MVDHCVVVCLMCKSVVLWSFSEMAYLAIIMAHLFMCRAVLSTSFVRLITTANTDTDRDSLERGFIQTTLSSSEPWMSIHDFLAASRPQHYMMAWSSMR